MRSMTGYGRGEASKSGYKVTVEMSSVNRKQSEVAVYLPRELESLEPRVRDLVNRQIARGRLLARLTLHSAEGNGAGRVEVNIPLARAYAKELAKLARELKLNETVTLEHILKAPGVLRTDAVLEDAEKLWPAIETALGMGLDQLVRMREREGEHLMADLEQRIAAMRLSVQRIEKRAPLMVVRYRKQLQVRIRNAGLEWPSSDDERLAKEVVYFAERSDISEELTRLQSHFKQFQDTVRQKGPVGRTLDFLAQEMNREVNTIGSKSSDAAVSKEVVKLKAELEKFREQVQNVE